MDTIPYERFATHRVAFGSYGVAQLAYSRRTLLVFALLGAVLALYAVGVLSFPEAGIAAGFSAGFSRAANLREQALAKLMEAKELTDENGEVAPENLERFDAIMTEFHDIDRDAGKAQTNEDKVGTLRERMEYYTGKATGQPMRFTPTVIDPDSPKSAGEQFIESKAYKDLIDSGALRSENSRFRSDPVVVGAARRFGAAATDIVNSETGQPGNALVTPFYMPGILPLQQRPTIVRDLFPNDSMPTGDTISYAAQTGFDNAAAAVEQATSAENGAKPQSSIAWARRTATAETIATWMAATRQALSDSSILRSLIDNQGRLMIRIEEDDQLLNGNGTSPNLSGILDQSSLQTLDLTGEDNLDGIRTARRLVKTGVSRLDPTFIVVNPIDSEEIDILKDENGLYRGGNPIGNFAFDQPIWRLRRAESEAIAEGIALVGAGAGATVFERQPLTVLTADQHADFFVRNLIVILFEERLAFPVWFPTAFVEVTLAEWSAS